MTRTQQLAAILEREFRKAVAPADPGSEHIVHMEVIFPDGEEEIWVLADGHHWTMKISSDDDQFFFRDPYGEELSFPFPDDWLELQ